MSQQLSELPWIGKARSYIGLYENTSKTEHNPVILDMLNSMGNFNGEQRSWWKDDETPWCGLFVGYVLGTCQRTVIDAWYRAKAWDNPSMTKLDAPAYGCIAVFSRTGGGHIGFVVGRDKAGNIMVLGGNQGNAVNIKPFAPRRVTGYYWPSVWRSGMSFKSSPFDSRYMLPILDSDGRVSENEA